MYSRTRWSNFNPQSKQLSNMQPSFLFQHQCMSKSFQDAIIWGVAFFTIPQCGPADAVLKKTHRRVDMCKAGQVDVSRSGKYRPAPYTSSVHLARAHFMFIKYSKASFRHLPAQLSIKWWYDKILINWARSVLTWKCLALGHSSRTSLR